MSAVNKEVPDTLVSENLPLFNAVVANQLVQEDLIIQGKFDAVFGGAPILGKVFPDEYQQLTQDGALPAWSFITQTVFNVIASILAALMPAAIALLWVDVWQKTKELYYAHNRNYRRTLDLVVSVIRAVIATTIAILFLAATTKAMVYAAPVLLGVAIVASTAYAAFKFVQSFRKAIRVYQRVKAAKDKVKESKRLDLKNLNEKQKTLAETKTFFRQISFSAIGNIFFVGFGILAFMANYYLGRATQDLYEGNEKIANNDYLGGYQDIKNGADTYLSNKRLVESFELFSAGLFITKGIKYLFNSGKETIQFYSEPKAAYQALKQNFKEKIESFKELWEKGSGSKAIAILSIIPETLHMAAMAAFHVAPAILGLIWAAKKGISRLINGETSVSASPQKTQGSHSIIQSGLNNKGLQLKPSLSALDETYDSIEREVEREELLKKIDSQIENACEIDMQNNSPDHQQKIEFLQELKVGVLGVNGSSNKMLNPIPANYEVKPEKTVSALMKQFGALGAFQAFRKDMSETEKRGLEVKQFQNKWYVAKP